MKADQIKEKIEELISENPENTYTVEILLKKIEHTGNNKDIRKIIKEVIISLAKNPKYEVNLNDIKSIKLNKDRSQEIKKINIDKLKIKNISILGIFFIGCVILSSSIINTFLFFIVSLFLVFLIILFTGNEDNANILKILSEKFIITVPSFTFVYYILSSTVFSKYSSLSLNDNLTTSNNMYYISISMLFSILSIITVKNWISFCIMLFYLSISVFIGFHSISYVIIIVSFIFITNKSKNKKYHELFLIHLESLMKPLTKECDLKNTIILLLAGLMLCNMYVATLNIEGLKRSYYENIEAYNNGYCKNLHNDIKIIKDSNKYGYVNITSDEISKVIYINLLNENINIKNIKKLKKDITIQSGPEGSTTYNNIVKYMTENIEHNEEIKRLLKKEHTDKDFLHIKMLSDNYLDSITKNQNYLFLYICN